MQGLTDKVGNEKFSDFWHIFVILGAILIFAFDVTIRF